MGKRRFELDKAEWQWKSACEIYCREFNKSEDKLTEEDNKVIWEYGANHISFFLTWLIDNDLLSKMHGENKQDITKVKSREMTGFEYLSKNCDMVLSREDLSRKTVKFTDEFYESYIDEYCEYMENKLKKVVLGTCFSWEDYNEVKNNIIDTAYNKFVQNRMEAKAK